MQCPGYWNYDPDFIILGRVDLPKRTQTEPKRTQKGTQKDPKGTQKETQKDLINNENYIIIRISGENKYLGIFWKLFFLNFKTQLNII